MSKNVRRPAESINILQTARKWYSISGLISLATMIGIPTALAQDDQKSSINWKEISNAASKVVSKESPASAFPFNTAITGHGKSLIIAHYFTFFPLTYDGFPTEKDYYSTEFLRASGESGKHAKQGGFLRERPLPAPFLSPQAYFRHANLATDVARASRIGLDGFGVNLLSISDNEFMPTARRLLDAATASGTGFKIFPEPDMSAMPGLSPEKLVEALMVFAEHPAALQRDGALLVMPIAAEAYPPEFWRKVTEQMRRRGRPIVLMPCYYDPAPASMEKLREISWGVTFWGTRGPGAGVNAGGVIDLATKLGFSRWMFPVSPQDTRPKDLAGFETGNSQGYRDQWNEAIARNAKMVQIITWNDYSETSEISPSSFSKFVFYDLTAYYTAWLKTGRAPTITRDAFYFVQRGQIFRPDTPVQGARWGRWGDTPWSNNVEVVAFLVRPGELMLKSGSKIVRKLVGSGLQTISVPAQPGNAAVSLRRNGRVVAHFGSPISIEERPERHDPTYGGDSSLRVEVDRSK